MASSQQSGEKDILQRVETYLAKRDGVDKLLKIARYASKIIIASSVLPEDLPLNSRLKSFESSVGVSRKALRLGKFIQDLNDLRDLNFDSINDILPAIAYGGEGLYYFTEQFVWLSKSGLIDARHSPRLQKISAWAEFIGYIGSISQKFIDLKKMADEKAKPDESKRYENIIKLQKLKISLVQDCADWLMAFADIRGGKGYLTNPLLLSSAGLLSALISTFKIWISS